MSKEHLQPPEPFEFNERETLWNRLSDQRFQAMLADEQTAIHKVELSTNAYGEFVFVTVCRSAAGKQQLWTLYGLGRHEYRERWYMNEWHFYRAHPFPETVEKRVSPEEVEEMLHTRR